MNIDKTINSLRSKLYEVSFFKTKEEAAAYLNDIIDNKSVGFGDSETMLSMNLYSLLSQHNTVYDPIHCEEGEDFYSTAKKCLITDIFLTSVNAIAETGEMINIDGIGNRVAGSLYGHDKVYFIVGTNKIVKSLEEARYRARNYAAPLNSKRHGLETPCTVKLDKCYDCSHKDRVCRGEMIYLYKMHNMDMEVILIDEELGL